MRLISHAWQCRFLLLMTAGLALAGCGNGRQGLPERQPSVVMPPPPPPVPAPPPAVTILYYGAVQGDEALALLSGDVMAQRFLVLKQLAEATAIPPQAALDRITVNKGALLPLTQMPPATGLDAAIPPVDKIFATVRSLPPNSNGLMLVLDGILPQAPRSRQILSPQTKQAARLLLPRLAKLESTGLISPEERALETDALYALLNSDRVAETDVLPPPPPPPPPPKTHGGGNGQGPVHRNFTQLYIPDPDAFQVKKLDEKAGGKAGLYLMQVPDPSQTEKAWNMLKTQSPELANLGMVMVRTDLGAVGVTWRLVAGPVGAEDAKKLCDSVMTKKQECTPVPFPKDGVPPPPPKNPPPAAQPKADAPKGAEAHKEDAPAPSEPKMDVVPIEVHSKAEPPRAEPAHGEAAVPAAEPKEEAHGK